MTEVDLDAVFPALEAHAAQLNKASDRANEVLAAVEKRLLKLNIGLEFWHSCPLDSTDPEGDLSPNGTSTRIVQLLGLAKVEGRWCLAVKPMRYVSGFYEGDTDCPFQNEYAAGAPMPLLGAARALRIEAMRRLPDFVVELTRHMESAIHDLELAAKKLR